MKKLTVKRLLGSLSLAHPPRASRRIILLYHSIGDGLWAVSAEDFKAQRRVKATFIVAVLSFLLNICTVKTHPSAAFYLAPHRVWEVLVGALLAMAGNRALLGAGASNIVCLAGLGAIATATFSFTSATTFPGASALLPVLGTAAIIGAGRNTSAVVPRMLGARPLVFIGKVSYSLYLWHFPLLALAGYVTVDKLSGMEKALIIGLSCAFATLSWIYVERPVRRLGDGPQDRRMIFGGAALVMATFAGLGLAIHFADGFSRWLDPSSRRILASETDWNPDRDACATDDLGRISRGDFCHLGSGGDPPRFILWGDSHAEVLRSAVNESAFRNGWTGVFAGLGGCAPILEVRRVDEPECGPVNQAIAHYIQATPSIGTVLLSARWGLWAEGTRYKREDRKPDKIVIQSSNKADDSASGNHAAFSIGLIATIEMLQSSGKKVWLVGPVPEIGYIVPRFIYLKNSIGLDYLDIRPTREDFNLRQEFVLPFFKKLSERYFLQALWIDDTLCDQSHCQVEQQGVPIYQDDNHLTKTESIRLAPVFDPVFH